VMMRMGMGSIGRRMRALLMGELEKLETETIRELQEAAAAGAVRNGNGNGRVVEEFDDDLDDEDMMEMDGF